MLPELSNGPPSDAMNGHPNMKMVEVILYSHDVKTAGSVLTRFYKINTVST